MDEQKTQQNIIPLLKDIDALAQALQIQDCSPELQLKVINEWSGLLFKRLLLRIPAEYTAQAQKTIAEMHAKGKDSAELIDALAEYIPDFEKSLEEEIARTLNEFSTAKSK
ncbi:MAG: hypothetical protein A3D65_02660 [Candidatus Lloydbacteria bacterium RIFCSPHIGHO2_02_FULL_50_13]|uniref:Uncharacterized protein n=1 Tax=Candidatus Lloydbacteria bacterium RIFCSPHIGHO2_02_FULL_50_13 TaxID=1798661 RepID=A0A1G2D3S5_9BACT|nr:MAG: hypothetical protein A3D65_02660 [Candidatus Lloydbacteria bacterium RIFCSPHIGHO2_02_FULL_50_13]